MFKIVKAYRINLFKHNNVIYDNKFINFDLTATDQCQNKRKPPIWQTQEMENKNKCVLYCPDKKVGISITLRETYDAEEEAIVRLRYFRISTYTLMN